MIDKLPMGLVDQLPEHLQPRYSHSLPDVPVDRFVDHILKVPGQWAWMVLPAGRTGRGFACVLAARLKKHKLRMSYRFDRADRKLYVRTVPL